MTLRLHCTAPSVQPRLLALLRQQPMQQMFRGRALLPWPSLCGTASQSRGREATAVTASNASRPAPNERRMNARPTAQQPQQQDTPSLKLKMASNKMIILGSKGAHEQQSIPKSQACHSKSALISPPLSLIIKTRQLADPGERRAIPIATSCPHAILQGGSSGPTSPKNQSSCNHNPCHVCFYVPCFACLCP